MNQTNKNYWKKRLKKFDEIYITETTTVLDALEYYYKETYTEVLRELAVLRLKFPNTTTPYSREILMEETLNRIDKQLSLLYENEVNIVGKSLRNAYVSTYLLMNDTLKTLGVTVKEMIPNAVEDAIRYNWSGATFSNRIWHRKDKLLFNMKETISRGLIRESSYHEMAEELSKRMNVSYDACRNLVNTEVQAIQVRATVNNYQNNGIEKCEVSAILDTKACNHCREHDGDIVEVDKVIMSVDIPPFHTNCRCCLLPVVE